MTTHALHPAGRLAAAAAATAGGILLTAIGHLALAPTARADDPAADIAADLALLYNAGTADFAGAANDFAAGDFATGLGLTMFGSDDYLISPEEALVVDVAQALSGQAVTGSYDLTWPGVESFSPPMDLADTFSEMQSYALLASQEFTQAATYFATGDLSEGLLFSFVGFDNLVVGSPEILAIGLAESLFTGL